VYILEVAAEIVFVFNRVTSCCAGCALTRDIG
jgi:hypothetical protein